MKLMITNNHARFYIPKKILHRLKWKNGDELECLDLEDNQLLIWKKPSES